MTPEQAQPVPWEGRGQGLRDVGTAPSLEEHPRGAKTPSPGPDRLVAVNVAPLRRALAESRNVGRPSAPKMPSELVERLKMPPASISE